jgi:hypothetical protein
VLLVLAVSYLSVALGYDFDDRAVPLGVAALCILLLLLDIFSRGEGRIAVTLRRILQGRGQQPAVPGLDGQAGVHHHPMKEVAAFGWIIGFLILALIFGFYIAIPIYVICYLRFFAGKSLVAAAATGIGLTAILYAMFELLLGYSVFGGFITGDFL